MGRNTIRLLAYSDIHHDEYKNGITGEDVASIEDQFTDMLIDRKCDAWIFAGDRFASRNPYDITRHRADGCLLHRSNQFAGLGILLVGNHDQWKKNAELGHSMLHTEKLVDNTVVIDTKRQTLRDIGGNSVSILGVPAGREDSKTVYHMTPEIRMSIALYHGMLRGSRYQNGHISDHGHDTNELDDSKFDLVLCGDNHAHQKLNMFKNTNAWYIGAPMQHNWGDAGAERGFMYFEFGVNSRALHGEFIPTVHPKFIKQTVNVTSSKDALYNNILRVSLTGKNDDLSKIDTSAAETMALKLGARVCEFKPKFDNTAITLTSSSTKTVTDSAIWADYIKAKSSAIEDLDANLLNELAKEYL